MGYVVYHRCMIEQAVLYIQSVIAEYGAWGVLVATLIEETVAPIPSALVPLAAGFFLLPPDAGFAIIAVEALFLVALPVTVGISIASAGLYALAYYGGKPIIEKNRRLIGISWKDVERIERRMTKGKRDEIILFILRIIPIFPGFALSIFCGIVRYPFTKFMVITFLGAGLRAYALAIAGWQAGEFYLRYLEVIDKFEHQIFIAAAVLLVACGIGYFFWIRSRKA